MLASADPSARFMLVCRRFACAARTAAHVSGNSTSIAITIPITAFGAPACSTVCSISGDKSLASPTTDTSETTRRAKLSHVSRSAGGTACASGLDASTGGRK